MIAAIEKLTNLISILLFPILATAQLGGKVVAIADEDTLTLLHPMNYQKAIQEAAQFLEAGNRMLILEAFKQAVSGDKPSPEDITSAPSQ